MLGRSGGILFSALKRITGIDLLQDLSEFFQSFGDMAQGFSERAQRVNELLGDRRTTFLLVTAPERDPIEEAFYFWRRLKEARLPFGGVVVNKVHPDYVADGPPPSRPDGGRRWTSSVAELRARPSTGRPRPPSWRRRWPRTSSATGCWPSATARTWRC